MENKTYIVVSRKNIEGKSDYGVCGAFSNKAEAESYVEKTKKMPHSQLLKWKSEDLLKIYVLFYTFHRG